MQHDIFVSGAHTTHLVEQMKDWQSTEHEELDLAAAILTNFITGKETAARSPWQSLGAWRGGQNSAWQASAPVVLIDDAGNRLAYWINFGNNTAVLTPMDRDNTATITVGFSQIRDRLNVRHDEHQQSYLTFIDKSSSGEQRIFVDCGHGPRIYKQPAGLAAWRQETKGSASDSSAILAPGPGTISSVAVAAGDKVKSGATIVVVESMKMLQTLAAPRAVEIDEVLCEPGQSVVKDDVLVTFKTSGDNAKS